jgi:hypothetical protein
MKPILSKDQILFYKMILTEERVTSYYNRNKAWYVIKVSEKVLLHYNIHQTEQTLTIQYYYSHSEYHIDIDSPTHQGITLTNSITAQNHDTNPHSHRI